MANALTAIFETELSTVWYWY